MSTKNLSQPQFERFHGDRPTNTLKDGDEGGMCLYLLLSGQAALPFKAVPRPHMTLLLKEEKKRRANAILIAWCNSWNLTTYSNLVMRTMTKKCVQRLLRARGNDWHPAEIAPSGMFFLLRTCGVALAEAMFGVFASWYSVTIFCLPVA